VTEGGGIVRERPVTQEKGLSSESEMREEKKMPSQAKPNKALEGKVKDPFSLHSLIRGIKMSLSNH